MVLETIGQKLKSAREGQGLSLSDIYQRTKIPVNHLQSIDNGAAEDLPEPVYVSGFIRRYAECVGLNPQSLVEEYRSADTANGNGRGKNHRNAVLEQPVIIASPNARTIRIEQGSPGFLRTMGVSVFWIVVILGLITFLFWFNSNNNSQQDSQEVISLRNVPNRFNNVGPSGAPLPAADKNGAPVGNTSETTDSRIALSANRGVWVEVKAVSSGDTLFSGNLEAGERRDFQDGQGLRVVAGSGGSLSVDNNGKSETFGLPGKRTERTFMAKAPAGASPPADGAATATPTTGSTPAVRPIVKKVTRRPAGDGAAAAPRRRIDRVGGDSYIPGESLGRGRSSYTDGRLDTD